MEKSLLESVCDISREIGDWMENERLTFDPNATELKGFNNLVSYVDRTSEDKFKEKLTALLPESSFLGEESGCEENNSEYLWIVDPLDGTTNYIHDLPIYCTSVALQKSGKTVIGVVYLPATGELFYADENEAYLNGKAIKVSETSALSDSLISTGFPYDDFERWHSYNKSFEYFARNTRGVRRMGAAAADLCYIACGRFDFFFEYALSPWDVAAGALIIEAAGGKVSDFSGGDQYIYGKEIIASNNNLFEKGKSVIQKNF